MIFFNNSFIIITFVSIYKTVNYWAEKTSGMDLLFPQLMAFIKISNQYTWGVVCVFGVFVDRVSHEWIGGIWNFLGKPGFSDIREKMLDPKIVSATHSNPQTPTTFVGCRRTTTNASGP